MTHKPVQRLQEVENVRNIGIIAHIDAGKTTVTEHFLYYSGKNYKIGDIDSGNTVMDYLDEERTRGITIVAAAASFEWKVSEFSKGLIHLIDTPGHIDFTAEVERSLRVIDGAVVIFSGVEGVQAQSEKVWRQSDSYNVPKIAFINKLDRTGASFERVFGEIRRKFPQVQVCALQIPIGIESDVRGIIDLLQMKAVYFEGEDGAAVAIKEIPSELQEAAKTARENMLHQLANMSDRILEPYLENKEIAWDLIEKEIRHLVTSNKLVPVFCGAAKKNIGIQPLLDAIVFYLPSPNDRDNFPAIHPKTGEKIFVHASDSAFCGLIFKIVASGSADLFYMRTYSGKIHLNNTLINSRTGEKIKLKRILRLYAKNVESIEEAGPGDIIGIIGPTGIVTGDTLCAVNRSLLLEKIVFPEPVISIAVEPKSNKDRDRLNACLEMLSREDPTLTISKNDATGQQIISGMGELHLEINCNRVRKDFNIQARFGIPQVAFRETLKTTVEVVGKFNKIIGERTVAGNVGFTLEPVPKLSSGIEVTNRIRNAGALPRSWIAAAEETLNNGLKTGGNWGYPLIYIRACLTNISVVDESVGETAVTGAVLDGLQKAIAKGTVILEPIMKIEILCPDNVVGEVTGYLQARRAVIHGIESLDGMKQLMCEVPLAEMFGFSKALPKLSGGRAAFSMEPCGYQEISERDIERIANRSPLSLAGT